MISAQRRIRIFGKRFMESDMTSILVKTKYFRSTIFGRDLGLPLPFLAVTCRATERALLRRFGPIDAVWLVHGQKITETRARDATHARGTPGVPTVHRGTTTDIPDRPRTTPSTPGAKTRILLILTLLEHFGATGCSSRPSTCCWSRHQK